MRTRSICSWLAASLVVAAGAAEESAQVEVVRLFKNGLAAVQLKGAIPASGTVTLPALPPVVHGTFWVRSDKPVTARAGLEPRPVALGSLSQPELLRSLAGAAVTLHLDKDTLQGTLLGGQSPADAGWDRNYASLGEGFSGWGPAAARASAAIGQPSLLYLRLAPGKVVALDPAQVRRVEFEAEDLKAERPVLRLECPGGAAVAVDYLTKGISWAPAYRIDLSDPKTLSITQQAVIRNEFADLKEVEIQLVSGFPSVRFGAVDSLLSPGATWAGFFSQLNQMGQGGSNPFDNRAIYNNVAQQVRIAEPAAGTALGPVDAGEGVDLHFESIGRRTLARGETLGVAVATAASPFERVVEWNIPDNRDAQGRLLQEYQRQQQGKESFDETPWDAIRFANPFKFPMTSAPALLVTGGQVQGQQMATWTNPGEQASIRITKALSISTRATEHEIPESRKNLQIAGNDFYKAQVEGELTVKNFRGRPAVMVIRRRFSGELLEAAGKPGKQLLEEGVYSMNQRNELSWRVEIAAGAEQVLKYKYEVLVDQ